MKTNLFKTRPKAVDEILNDKHEQFKKPKQSKVAVLFNLDN